MMDTMMEVDLETLAVEETAEVTKNQQNKASHTMSANARLLCHEPMNTNFNRLGTSTEAAIVWL